MKFKSSVYTQVSGSVGGLTYSHNKGGLYSRARSIPVNPATPFQTQVRNAVATLTNRWSNVLTQTQRNAWDVFAANVPVTDAFGDPSFISGLSWYVKANVPRAQAGYAVVDAAPTIFTLATFTAPTITVSAAADTADVTFTPSDAWAGEVGGGMLVYASRPQSVGINFFAGPYRFADSINGAALPPGSPSTLTLPFPVAVGNIVFFRVFVVRADGRPSADNRIRVVAA